MKQKLILGSALALLLSCPATPAQAQDKTQNYIRVRTMHEASGTRHTDEIRYYDGLGRPSLTLLKGITPKGNNLAALAECDAAGNDSLRWLPAYTEADYLEPEALKTLTASQRGDARPFARQAYQLSMLSRLAASTLPGQDMEGHDATVEYLANSSQAPLECNLYLVGTDGKLTTSGKAPDCTYHVTKNSDADGRTTYTFTDGTGKEVLLRQMDNGQAHDTYFVYDSFDRLRYVLTPEYADSQNLEKHAYRYEYDGLGRCTSAKRPGAAPVVYVYDQADRVIFTQDGEQKKKGVWTFRAYDAFGRQALQGECKATQPSQWAGKGLKATFTGADTGLDETGYTLDGTLENPVVLAATYYDDYRFTQAGRFAEAGITAGSTPATGKPTGALQRAVGTDEFICQATYYDGKGRICKQAEGNIRQGTDTQTSTLNFDGQPLKTVCTHTAKGKSTLTETYEYAYDPAGRLTAVDHALGNGTKVRILANEYDEYGRLVTEKLHNDVCATQYAYDVRDWTTAVSSPLFRQDIHYTGGKGTPQYAGNISSMTWQEAGGTTRGYRFTYDGLSRMTDAVYAEGANLANNPNRFNEHAGYDRNGNILSLKRYGQTAATAYGLIDNLAMTYDGNLLTAVKDNAVGSAYNGGFEFKDGASQATEYFYDENGNLTKDLNKNIARIEYNCLNLPRFIEFGDGSTINLTYLPDGTKIRTVYQDKGKQAATTEYCGNVIYENGEAKLLLTPGGYVTLDDKKYHYFLKDHQGNNRVVMSQEGKAEEVNGYYPFGGLLPGSTASAQPYKYNGKEWENRSGLGWYDYGTRWYDPAIARWNAMDPKFDKYYPWSPYNYCLDNPVRFVDPDGKYFVDANGKRIEIIYHNNGTLSFSKNASPDVIRAANALNLTSEGRIQLKNIDSSNIKVRLNIDNRTISSRLSSKQIKYTFGEAIQGNFNEKDNYGKMVNADGSYGIKEATITIYEGSIKKSIQKNSGYKHEGLTLEQALGAVVAHEGIHATDKNEINKDIQMELIGKERPDKEKKANQIEQIIIRQSKKKIQ